jgi:tetratricopeptide (TPR) repeat protein
VGKAAIRPSAMVSELLRRRREELGLSLREVEARSAAAGERVHFATLARAEQGKTELGTRRLWLLFKLYDLPFQLAADVMELERSGGADFPEGTFEAIGKAGLALWKAGNARQGLAHVFALRTRAPADPGERLARQRALLGMAVVAGAMGRTALSRYIVEGLLFERPDPTLLVATLLQAARCWRCLGSFEGALGFLARAEVHLAPGKHRERGAVLLEKASILVESGGLEEAAAAAKRAIEAYRLAGDARETAEALGAQVKVLLGREAWEPALRAAREARRTSERGGFTRLAAFRRIDEASALRALSRAHDALEVLKDVLVGSIRENDGVVRFYAHHALWKTYAVLGDPARAETERRAAIEFVQFVDDTTPETREVRALPPWHVVAAVRKVRKARKRRVSAARASTIPPPLR